MLKDIALKKIFPDGVKKKIFITGTDTEIGKTTVSRHLLHYFNQRNFVTVAAKPIASGCFETPQGYRNEDALYLQQAASIKLAYEAVNPFALIEPIAPHLAAKKQGIELSLQNIRAKCQPFLSVPADIHLVEGAGGWLVPLNDIEMLTDLAKSFATEIILVVAIRLGCINHALLTVQSILAHQVPFLGWIANHLTPDTPNGSAIIETLQKKIPFPLLAELPFVS